MAWLERDVRTGYYKVGFRVGNRKVKKSVQTSSRIEAKELLGVVEQTLQAVERGWTSVPPGVDLGEFLLSGGRLAAPLELPDKLRLSDLFEAYFAGLPDGSLEPSTISGMRQHERQLYRILGKSFDVRLLTTADLQGQLRVFQRTSQNLQKLGSRRLPSVAPPVAHLRQAESSPFSHRRVRC